VSRCVGIYVSAQGTCIDAAAGGRVCESGGSADGTAESTRSDRARRGPRDHACRARREYLELHQAEPATIAKLRWLLGKATSTLGGCIRRADLGCSDAYGYPRDRDAQREE
jgi:hypothetical protein